MHYFINSLNFFLYITQNLLGTRYKMLSSKKRKCSVYRKVSVFLCQDANILKDHYPKRQLFDSTEN